MEWIKDWHWNRTWIRKYRYLLILLLLGILQMTLPRKEAPAPQPELSQEQPVSLEESLGIFLSKVSGAGNVEVLLTESAGQETHYQQDEDTAGTGRRKDTVLITGGSREEAGLVRRVDPPTYQGAVILCQGADSAQVRLALVEAVKLATGLPTDRITVLKMK